MSVINGWGRNLLTFVMKDVIRERSDDGCVKIKSTEPCQVKFGISLGISVIETIICDDLSAGKKLCVEFLPGSWHASLTATVK